MKRWLFLLMIVSLWGYGLIQAWSIRPYRGQVFMYYREQDALKARKLEEARREETEEHAADTDRSRDEPGREATGLAAEEPGTHDRGLYPEITAWSLNEQVLVRNQELGKEKKADCMAVYGFREIASFRTLLDGTYGYRTDDSGCIISRGLAMELFGSVGVSGKHVWCRDRSYVVRGVTDDSGCLILIPAGKEEKMRYLLMDLGADSAGASEAERFLYRYGMDSGYVCVDGSLFFAAAGFSCVLFLWVVLAVQCYGLVKYGKKMTVRKRLKLAVVAAAVLLVSIVLIRYLRLQIPADLIPGKWSDFDFWTGKWKELHSRMGRMGEAYQVWWLKQLVKRTGVSAGCSVLSGVGFFLFYKQA